MRRFFLLQFLIILLASLEVNSQSFNAGILAGVNASQVSGDGYSGFNKAGILVGVYTDIDISQKVNLQFEINYSQKGSRKNPNTKEGDTEFFLMRLDYVEIPVMARFKNNRFTYEVGLYYGQLVNQYLEDENGPFNIPEPLNEMKSYDLGGLVGINFNFTENIIMNWRINQSILPVRDHDSGASWRFDSGLLHTYLSFTMRYEFIGGQQQ
ncbi:MAG: outer membrane beta-barrel protein [Vicingaceae bacterium]